MADQHDPNAPGWAAPAGGQPPPLPTTPPPPSYGAPPPPPPPSYGAPPPPPPGYAPPPPPPSYGAPPPPTYPGQPTTPYGIPYATGPTVAPEGEPTRVRGLAVAIAVFAVLAVLACAAAVAFGVALRSYYGGDGPIVPDDARAHYDDLFTSLGAIVTLAVPFGLVWIVWQRRIIANHRVLHLTTMKPSAAIWSWLIPVLNAAAGPISLHQVMSEPKRSPLVVAWAVVLDLGVVLGFVGLGYLPSEEVVRTPGDIQNMRNMALYISVGTGLLALAAALGAIVAWHATKTQEAELQASGRSI